MAANQKSNSPEKKQPADSVINSPRGASRQKTFRSVIKEIRVTLNDLFFFEHLLSSIIVFLLFVLVTSLFGFPFWTALIPAVLHFIVRAAQRVKENKIADIERLYPSLREKLRTAADTKDEE